MVERREDRRHVSGEGKQTLRWTFDGHGDVVSHLVHPEVVGGVVEAVLLDAAQHGQNGLFAWATDTPSNDQKA